MRDYIETGPIILSFCLFLFLGLRVFSGVLGNHEARSWVPTEGEIVRLEYEEKRARVSYSYEYQGERFSGKKYSFLSGGSSNEKNEIMNSFADGDLVKVYVNPHKPFDSILRIRSSVFFYIKNELFFLSLLLVFGSFGLYVKLKDARRTVVRQGDGQGDRVSNCLSEKRSGE